MSIGRSFSFSLIFSLVFLSWVFPQTEKRDEAPLQAFFERVWSPYCKGNSLLECPSGKAEDLRDQMRSMWQEGKSLEEIEVWLEKSYGDQIKMEPESSIRGQLAYTIPWLIFFIVLIFLAIYWIRRNKSSPPSSPQNQAQEEHQTIESEIEKEVQQRLS